MSESTTALCDIDLVLASTSSYRRLLVERLTPRVRQFASNVDEQALPDEMPAQLASRLAKAKAQAVAIDCPNALVIGSDQVAVCAERILGKPGTIERAHEQLRLCSGETVIFYTALCLIDTRLNSNHDLHQACDTTRVVFRNLADSEIQTYLEREQPLDCAGSFKCEGLGIALFERIESEDPTALIGLPLIALNRLLRTASVRAL